MNDEEWYYSAADIALLLVNEDVPARKQYDFLRWIFINEHLFLPQKWRNEKSGRREMYLAVQNASDYLLNPEYLDAEREAVEAEGGTLPCANFEMGAWQFMKAMRLKMALSKFSGVKKPGRRRMKCRTVLKECGIRRRSPTFCREFEQAATFYHIGLCHAGNSEVLFSIEDFSLDESIFLVRI